MPLATMAPKAVAPRPSLGPARILTLLVAVLGAVAAAGGIFLPDLYHGSAWIVNATRAQDWYTLVVAVPAMFVTLFLLRPGTVRAILVMTGITGYMLYTYTGAALTYPLNTFYLIYVALFALCIFAIAALVSAVDRPQMVRRFDDTTPHKAVSVYLIVMGLMLFLMEGAQLIPFYTTGTLPTAMRLAESTIFYPLGLDLGLVAPLCVLSGLWLWRRQPLGYLLTGPMLIMAATMGLLLVAANAYTWATGGVPDAVELLATYILIGAGGLGMAIWFFRHCRG